MKGIYVTLLLIVAVLAARSASQRTGTRTKSGAPPRRGGAAAGRSHPPVMTRARGGAPRGGASRGGAPPPKKSAAAESELEREGGRRRAGGRRRGSARASAPPAAPAAPVAPALPRAAPAAPAAPANKPCVITPVCGSDGFTYMSECFLWAGVVKSCDGLCPCPSPQVVPPRAAPRRANPPPPRASQIPPNARARPPACSCPNAWAPVCGTNGKTYDNDCKRRCSLVGLACQGTCPCKGGKLKQPSDIIAKPQNRKGTRMYQQNGSQVPIKQFHTTNKTLQPTNNKLSRQTNINNVSTNKYSQNGKVSSVNLSKKKQMNAIKGIPVYSGRIGMRMQYGTGNKVGAQNNTSRISSSSNAVHRMQNRGRSIQGSGRRGSGMVARPKQPKAITIQSQTNSGLTRPSRGKVRTSAHDSRNVSSKFYTVARTSDMKSVQNNSGVKTRNYVAGGSKNLRHSSSPLADKYNLTSGVAVRVGQELNKTNSRASLKRITIKTNRTSKIHRLKDIRPHDKAITYKTNKPINPGIIPETSTVTHSLKPNKNKGYAIKLSKTYAGIENVTTTSDRTTMRQSSIEIMATSTKRPRVSSRKPARVLNPTKSKSNNLPNDTKTPRKQRRCICPGKYKQVCGVNGKTYKNACRMKCSGMTQACDGACPCSQPPPPTCEDSCPKHYNPVCSVDSRTFNNDCFMRCSAVAKACDGSCPCNTPAPPKCEDSCPKTYTPVCSVDSRTFNNDCIRQCSGVGKECDGTCPCSQPPPPTCEDFCPKIYNPVCSVDSRTFSTECLMRCSGMTKACDGACPCRQPPPPKCEDSCPRAYSPVCSVDGITYDTDCHMICSGKAKACDAACPCPTTPRPMVCEDYCPSVYSPVCTVDGNTYGNDCRRRCSGKPKSCDSSCPCPTPAPPKCEDLCPRSYKPVCGVNGKTYNTDCLRRCSSTAKDCDGPCPCRLKATTPAPVSCESQCLQDYTPVCSTDGSTFKNECFRKCSGKPKDCNRACPCRKAPQKRPCEDYCPLEYEPVCSEEGSTFNNDCLRQCSGKLRACDGTCPCRVTPPRTTCEDACPKTQEPVCTVDGNTYDNDCLRNCSGKAKECDGLCPCRRSCEDYCPLEYKPQCGTNGQTFNNECLRGCSGVPKQCNGACPCPAPKTCEDYCPQDYQPVCTVYGNTYHNDCLRQCSGEQRQCEGSCPCEMERQNQASTFTCNQQCWWDRDPVCTTDGDTIWSSCVAICDYVGYACEGPCPCGMPSMPPAVATAPPAPGPFDCGCSPFEIDPVCTGEETIWNGCQAICQGKEIKCSSECPC